MDRYGKGILMLWFGGILLLGGPLLAQRYLDERGGVGLDAVSLSLALFILVGGSALMIYIALSPRLPRVLPNRP